MGWSLKTASSFQQTAAVFVSPVYFCKWNYQRLKSIINKKMLEYSVKSAINHCYNSSLGYNLTQFSFFQHFFI